MSLTIQYAFRPARPSVNTALVSDLFGVKHDAAAHVIAHDLEVPVRPGSVIAFTGPSGTGKSSLLRAVAAKRERAGERIVRPDLLPLPDVSVVDGVGRPFNDAVALLSRCGLAEARLLLRRPSELSDGERVRFRLALAIAQNPDWIVLDEFTAALDRTLAKVVAFNLRRQSSRTGIGFLVATCHDDVLDDLAPDIHVKCDHDGRVTVGCFESCGGDANPDPPGAASQRLREPLAVGSSSISFAADMSVAVGTLADWPQFARWHYRSHHVGSVRFVTVLRHGERPVGICVFSTPPLSLAARNRFFGRSGTWTRLTIGSLNRQLATISRVVLHPTYRGAGLAAAFVRQSCRICPYPWIEALAQMGRINPFFEKAGFTPIESSTNRRVRPAVRSPVHGVPLRRVGRRRVQESPARNDVSRGGEPTYYIFDNRESMRANASVATSTPRRLRPTSI